MIKKGLLVVVVLGLLSCQKEGCTDENALNYNPDAQINNGSCDYHLTTPYVLNTPLGFPDMLIPENNPMTVEGVLLGDKLFHEPLLSGHNEMACNSCHNRSFTLHTGIFLHVHVSYLIPKRVIKSSYYIDFKIFLYRINKFVKV